MIVLSRDPKAFASTAPHLAAHPAIRFVTGDVQKFTVSDVKAQMGDQALSFDFMIHAATAASAKLEEEDPQLMFDTILGGTRTALQFAVATGVRRFLFTSSGAVYGPQPSDLSHVPEDFFDSDGCGKPTTSYGRGKREAEALCGRFHTEQGIEPLIARCFAFVGPFLPLDTHFAIGNFIRDALRGEPIRIGGDGTPFRSYLYAADLAIWLWTILFRGQPMRPYNVGSARDLTIAQLAETVRTVLAPALKIEIAKKSVPNTAPTRYVPANNRAATELGLDEGIELEEAVRRTARFHSLAKLS
jgi:dTDP-glucose 4,6-dehydratase